MKPPVKHILNCLVLLSIGLFCLHSVNAEAQNISDLTAQGDLLYQEGDYYSASQYYYQALQLDSTRLKTLLKYAESCRLFLNYEEAARWYQKLLQQDDKNKHPEARFWLGMMQKNLGDYQLAIQQFQQYLLDNPDEKDLLNKRARQETEACAWAVKAGSDSLPVSIRHLGNSLNTVYSDFGAMQMGDSLLFFSSLQLENDLQEDPIEAGNYIANLYVSKLTPAGPFLPQVLPVKINEPLFHNANLCFSKDHQTMYFTRCPDERVPELRCTLYMVKWKNGKWQKPVPLNDKINLPGFTTTHPAIAHGEKDDLLFFVSDRPGGFGGKDLWYAVVRKGKFYDPANLGSQINTPGDEITPFYDNKTGRLYFSSDWHQGFGGFDIFRSTGTLNDWTKPENLGYPLNTSYNDIYLTVNENDSNGYLTSNRPGSLYIKNLTCCNDLYQYAFMKPKPKISSTDSLQQIPDIKQQIRELLPLTLYFHNDEPDPATTKEITFLNYRTTVAGYYLLKDKYIAEYTEGLSGNLRLKAEKDILSFFDDHVLHGLTQLDAFTELLLLDLQRGKKVIITIKGFTSPLNTAEYNKSLAKRRISSLINYFREYQDGIFLPYLENQRSPGGSLTFEEEPIGEEQSSKLVSDNPRDIRNSVYSRSAALERRIQILYYNSN